MKFTLFLGCNIPARVQQYELSARAVSRHLNIGIEDNPEFKCCGNPIRNTDNETFLRMAARNLALAEQQSLDMMVLCKCCFGALKKAAHTLDGNASLKDEINKGLADEGLAYEGRLKIKHFLSVLYHDIGTKTIKESLSRSYKKLNIATHYGCHALRPSDVTEFDNPVAPIVFDDLVKVTGAKSIAWPLKLECCGAPLLGINDELSLNLTKNKLIDGKTSGADYMCAACPYCQMQFDKVQKLIPDHSKEDIIPSLVYPQLLGLAMGLSKDEIGVDLNTIDISNIESYLE